MCTKSKSAVLLAALIMITGAACASGGGSDGGETDAPTETADTGGNGVPVGPNGDTPDETVILAPIKVPPFGGDAEFSPHTIARFVELVTQGCGGSMCVTVDFDVTPPGFEPVDDTRCEITSIAPSGEVPRGSTVEVGVSCSEQGNDGGETSENPEGETAENGGTDGG